MMLTKLQIIRAWEMKWTVRKKNSNRCEQQMEEEKEKGILQSFHFWVLLKISLLMLQMMPIMDSVCYIRKSV